MKDILNRITARRRTTPLPEGRIYAVGDIHGRLDLLERLYEKICTDLGAGQAQLVFLGDYVDRGLDSRGVLEFLSQLEDGHLQHVFLKGNHEATMLAFLQDPTVGPMWFANGGDAALFSYGVKLERNLPENEMFARAAEQLNAHVPHPHQAFLQGLQLTFQSGNCLFVHAGIRPGVALHDQDEHDLMWIREPFLSAPRRDGVVVIHGHSLDGEPQVKADRIGIDTGAYATGRLTAAVLGDGPVRFIAT